jgi:TRAP-type C4-dicarboxylate transport system permease small subunit
MSLLQKADAALYRAERAAAGLLFLFMAFIMFASVTHRVFSREEGRLAVLVGDLLSALGLTLDKATLHGPVSSVLSLGIAFWLTYMALRTMKRARPLSAGKALLHALGITAVLTGVIQLLLVVLPNGLVWGPVMAMASMLWVSFLGASIATYEKRHLALEMGEKIWPERAMPAVRSLGMVATALFAGFLLALAIVSVKDHHAGWAVNPLAGNLLPTQIPKWVIFLIIPYTFLVMTLRFLGLAAGALRGETVHEEKIG